MKIACRKYWNLFLPVAGIILIQFLSSYEYRGIAAKPEELYTGGLYSIGLFMPYLLMYQVMVLRIPESMDDAAVVLSCGSRSKLLSMLVRKVMICSVAFSLVSQLSAAAFSAGICRQIHCADMLRILTGFATQSIGWTVVGFFYILLRTLTARNTVAFIVNLLVQSSLNSALLAVVETGRTVKLSSYYQIRRMMFGFSHYDSSADTARYTAYYLLIAAALYFICRRLLRDRDLMRREKH